MSLTSTRTTASVPLFGNWFPRKHGTATFLGHAQPNPVIFEKTPLISAGCQEYKSCNRPPKKTDDLVTHKSHFFAHVLRCF